MCDSMERTVEESRKLLSRNSQAPKERRKKQKTAYMAQHDNGEYGTKLGEIALNKRWRTAFLRGRETTFRAKKNRCSRKGPCPF